MEKHSGILIGNAETEKQQSLCPALQKACTKIRQAYGDSKNFLVLFNPTNGIAYTRNEEDAFMGKYPVLAELNATYGETMAQMWLIPQLKDISEYAGCRDKFTMEQLERTAQVIADNYYFLKVTEILVFFERFRSARYGRFYGAVDSLLIMEALNTFVRERNDIINKYESQYRQRDLERKRFIPPTGYTSLSYVAELRERAKNGDKEAIEYLNSWKK